MAITGNIYITGAVAAILGGLYWKRTSRTGAIAAMLGGLLSLAGLFSEPIQEIIPWLTISVIGLINYVFFAVLLVIFSLLYPDTGSAE